MPRASEVQAIIAKAIASLEGEERQIATEAAIDIRRVLLLVEEIVAAPSPTESALRAVHELNQLVAKYRE